MLVFALIVASKRLRPYFQAHLLKVLTDHPFKKVLQKLNTSGRLAKWAIELSKFDMEY